jgi:hypothetical protein
MTKVMYHVTQYGMMSLDRHMIRVENPLQVQRIVNPETQRVFN